MHVSLLKNFPLNLLHPLKWQGQKGVLFDYKSTITQFYKKEITRASPARNPVRSFTIRKKAISLIKMRQDHPGLQKQTFFGQMWFWRDRELISSLELEKNMHEKFGMDGSLKKMLCKTTVSYFNFSALFVLTMMNTHWVCHILIA